jgi:pimeloyl-ACP methyl ester carboxylesterase
MRSVQRPDHRRYPRQYRRAARDARLEIIALAGHTASLDQPEAFTAALLEFAGSIGV